MAFYSKRKRILSDLEVVPAAKSSIPSGSDGQVAVATDVVGARLLVREGSELVPAVDSYLQLSTQTDITMTVDPSTGVSPPVGTIVRSQAEYDALGAPLKYAHDADRILPYFVDHIITVNFEAGIFYADPSLNAGSYAIFMRPLVHQCRNKAHEIPEIHYKGSTSEYEASQAGTCGFDNIFRDSGTWTVNELQGKKVLITSGVNAGEEFIITSNTADTLYFMYNFSTTGACEFQIISLDTIFRGKEDGGFGFCVCMANTSQRSPNNLTRRFEDIQFGDATSTFNFISTTSGNLQFKYCFFRHSYLLFNLQTEWARERTFLTITDSLIIAEGNAASMILAHTYSLISRLAIYSITTTDAISLLPGSTLRCSSGLHLYGVGTGIGIKMSGGIIDCDSGVVEIIDGFDTGILVHQEWGYVSLTDTSVIYLNNNNIALNIKGRTINLEHYFRGSGNITGWKLEGGAKIFTMLPEYLEATNDMEIDGTVFDYATYVSNVGDSVVGSKGSELTKI